MRYLLSLVGLLILCTACRKNSAAETLVEIYVLKSHQQVAGKCQIDAATAVLQDTPLIRNNDIVAYSKGNYTFELTGQGITRLKAFAAGYAFAVTVDKQVIYYGYNTPLYSSFYCAHSITTNLFAGINEMLVSYPGTSSGIDDQRNSPKLIAALSDQGKLR